MRGLRPVEPLADPDAGAWRLRIPQRKTRGSLWLPLTDEAGTALLDYLRHGSHAPTVRRQRVPLPAAVDRGAPGVAS